MTYAKDPLRDKRLHAHYDSLCPQCGRGVLWDEDDLCTTCGALAVGEHTDGALRELDLATRERDGLRERVEHLSAQVADLRGRLAEQDASTRTSN